MASLQELTARLHALDQQITALRSQGREAALAEIRALMEQFALSRGDLSGRAAAKGAGTRKPLAAKYRNAATGETWSGRGRQPRWLAAAVASGLSADEFRV